MNVLPAIDVQAGQCVRLFQGRFDQATVYPTGPLQMAKWFETQGASWVHVVDLDGARQGRPVNVETIEKIVHETGLKVQVGGGIRTTEHVEALLGLGAARVIVGSVAISQPAQALAWLEKFGAEALVLALDCRPSLTNGPVLAVDGWQADAPCTLWQALDAYAHSPLRHVLCTDITRDGTLLGPHVNLYQRCVTACPGLAFQASGGIGRLEDLQALALVPVAGAIVGKAIYEGHVSLRAALAEAPIC